MSGTKKNINNSFGIDRIVEINNGLLIGVHKEAPILEIVGFTNPQSLLNQTIREKLGKKITYKNIESRDLSLESVTVSTKAFIAIGQQARTGRLIGGGFNHFSDEAFLVIVGFANPEWVSREYERLKLEALSSKKEEVDDEEGKKSFWPKNYWEKFSLGKKWMGTMMTNDSVSMRLTDTRQNKVVELPIQVVYRQ